jgi:pimeloyl-ACP methyl ester carboxylesterase
MLHSTIGIMQENPLNAIQSSTSNALERVKYGAKPSRTGKILAVSAVALAAVALYNTWRARKVERDYPPTGRFITVDGIRLHYIEKGEGPPVVLLHGNVVTAEDYVLSGVFNRVAERHRVIAFDRPGFGFSERPRGVMWTPAQQADLLRKAFARLGIERAVIVGHSWGTLVALALALNHRDVVSGLTLLSGYYDWTLRADAPPMVLTAIPVIGDVMRYTVSPLFGRAVMPLVAKGMFSPRPVPERFTHGSPYAFAARPSQIRAESQDGTTMVPAAVALRKRIRELRMPIVIMAGTKDRVVGFESHAVGLHEELPNSDLRLIPDVGHMLHYAVPDQVAEAIESVADHQGRGT